MEKPHGELTLEKLNLLCQRRLRYAKALCGAGKMQLLGENNQAPKVTKFQCLHFAAFRECGLPKKWE